MRQDLEVTYSIAWKASLTFWKINDPFTQLVSQFALASTEFCCDTRCKLRRHKLQYKLQEKSPELTQVTCLASLGFTEHTSRKADFNEAKYLCCISSLFFSMSSIMTLFGGSDFFPQNTCVAQRACNSDKGKIAPRG